MATRKKPTRRATTAKRKGSTQRPQRRQPESLRLSAVGVSLTVNNLERSIAWYRDALGFTPGERWEENGRLRGVQMKAGRCDIMLNQDDFAKGRDRKKGEGFRVWVDTAQDLDAIAARIKATGWPLDREPSNTPWGDWAFALTDPDGFKFTFIQAD
jgi:uncharacterized glyoxalase superfamily protein PhnB